MLQIASYKLLLLVVAVLARYGRISERSNKRSNKVVCNGSSGKKVVKQVETVFVI